MEKSLPTDGTGASFFCVGVGTPTTTDVAAFSIKEPERSFSVFSVPSRFAFPEITVVGMSCKRKGGFSGLFERTKVGEEGLADNDI